MLSDDQIVDLILLFEGEAFTDDPDDRGSATKFGITVPTLSRYLGRPATVQDVKALDRDTASKVYRELFIAPFAGLFDPIRTNVIDLGVHSGVKRATIMLQQLIGATVDGDLGPQTRQLAAQRNWNMPFMGARIVYYESIIRHDRSQMKWRTGWRRRALSFADVSTVRGLRSSAPIFEHMGKAFDGAGE